MSIEKETVERLAHLARLNLTGQQVSDLQNDLGKIIDWVEKLNEIDTREVEPLLTMSPEVNHWRSDDNVEHIDRNEVVKRAPDSDGKFINVPRVI